MYLHNRFLIAAGLGLALSACGNDDPEAGPQGTPGKDGVAGKDGTDGTNGRDGTDGQDGMNGQDGTDGQDGMNGTDGQDGRDGPPEIVFTGVQVPTTDAEKRAVLASPSVTLNGTASEIGYRTILRSGDQVAGTTFGVLTDVNGNALVEMDNSPVIANSTDFTSLLPVGNKLFSVTHLESNPGGMYVTELTQDQDGMLTPISTQAVDFSSVDGLWTPCAGSVTPWTTHLGSEEYPADARTWEAYTAPSEISSYWTPFLRYYGLEDATSMAQINALFNPYAYGFAVEVSVDAAGTATPVKHYAMGRMALELAKVMPDQKTAYLTDDGTNVGFYMFIADTAGDLSAGTLYGAQLIQTSPDGAPGLSADIEWVDLGHATNAQVAQVLSSGTTFSDIFNTAAPTLDTDGSFISCPTGFRSINTEAGVECLQLVNGMALAASRLETRRYLAYLGGTTEFRKEEGLAFDPKTKTLFVAMSAVERGMESFQRGGSANLGYDRGGPNHLRTAYNRCGAVYGLKLYPSAAIGSDYVAQSWRTITEGTMVEYPEGSIYEGNLCSVNGIANPDNLTFFPGYDVLVIGEDAGREHQNDAVWTYDMKTGDLTRILTTPYGSETTSPYVYPNIDGFGYLMTVIQHPFGESDQDQLLDPADARAYVGFVGPFPALD